MIDRHKEALHRIDAATDVDDDVSPEEAVEAIRDILDELRPRDSTRYLFADDVATGDMVDCGYEP